MTISMVRAKALCTASELAIVQSSTRTEIGKLSPARLKQKVTLARKLRDKWRAQSIRQRRATQLKRGVRETEDNSASAEKAELFGEVLDRFTTQLKKVEPSAGGPVGPRKQPSRKSRTGQHRQKRAATRKVLEETRQELTSAPPAARKMAAGEPTRNKSAKKAAPPKRSADALPSDSNQSATAASSLAPAAQPAKKPRTSTSPRPLEAGHQSQGLKVTEKSQLKAGTAAKRTRIKIGGHIHTHKHISAANKRRQARRDSRDDGADGSDLTGTAPLATNLAHEPACAIVLQHASGSPIGDIDESFGHGYRDRFRDENTARVAERNRVANFSNRCRLQQGVAFLVGGRSIGACNDAGNGEQCAEL